MKSGDGMWVVQLEVKWSELGMKVPLARRIGEARGVVQADPGRCKWREHKGQAVRPERAWCSSNREDLRARDGHSREAGAPGGGRRAYSEKGCEGLLRFR